MSLVVDSVQLLFLSLFAFVRIRSRNIFSPTLIYPKRVLSIKSANLKIVPEPQKTIRSSETEFFSESVKRIIIALGVVVKCPMTEIAIPKERDFWPTEYQNFGANISFSWPWQVPEAQPGNVTRTK